MRPPRRAIRQAERLGGRGGCRAFFDHRVSEQFIEPGCNTSAGETGGRQAGPDTQIEDAAEGVQLVVSHRLDQMGNPGAEGLGAGADAAVIDEGGRAGQHLGIQYRQFSFFKPKG